MVVLLQPEDLGFEFVDDGFVVGGGLGGVFGEGDEDIEVRFLEELDLFLELFDFDPEGAFFLGLRIDGFEKF